MLAYPAVPTVAAESTGSQWCGTYVFDGAVGHTAGGSPITYHYTLSLQQSAAGPRCTLHLQGYQQDEMLRCTTDGGQGAIRIEFAAYANGALVNAYGVHVYQPGESLFELARESADGRRIRTIWRALHPDGTAASGEFFRRLSR